MGEYFSEAAGELSRPVALILAISPRCFILVHRSQIFFFGLLVIVLKTMGGRSKPGEKSRTNRLLTSRSVYGFQAQPKLIFLSFKTRPSSWLGHVVMALGGANFLSERLRDCFTQPHGGEMCIAEQIKEWF